MFTEYEIETMIEVPEISEATRALKKQFLSSEAPYLKIKDEDFYSLIVMSPTVGIALADGKITLNEELTLNKKARKLSIGAYFLKKDPVVYAMNFLMKKYDKWEEPFFDVLKVSIKNTCQLEKLEKIQVDTKEKIEYSEYKKAVLKSPYILIRFITSFFLESDENIINKNQKKGAKEYNKILDIGKKLELDKFPVYQMFIQTFR